MDATAEGLTTLYLAWVLSETTSRLPSDLVPSGETLRLTCNLSVPIDQADTTSPLRKTYQRIAANAWRLRHHVTQGISAATALGWLETLAADSRPAPQEILVQPETLAAIMSYVNSREAQEGMYALVDIGAWTTDISFVRVSDVAMMTEGLRTTAIYDARTFRTAAGKIDEKTREMLENLWQAEGLQLPTDRSAVTERLREMRESGATGSILIGGAPYPNDARALDFARSVVAKSVGSGFVATRERAKVKESSLSLSQWARLRTLMLGGGSEEQVFRQTLTTATGSRESVKFLPTTGRLVLASQTPPAVVRRLQVAAGLAIPYALWPKVFTPSKVDVPRPTPAQQAPPSHEWDGDIYRK